MFTRRKTLGFLAASTVVAPAVLVRHARAETSLRWGHSMPSTHPLSIFGHQVVEKIRTETDGRVAINLFTDGALGGDSDMLSQVRSGGLDIYTPGASNLSTLAPVSGIVNTAFAFSDSTTAWKALDGQVGQVIHKKLADLGLYSFDKMWALGFRQMTTALRPIEKPADLAGLKIRVPTSPMLISIFKNLGASPVGMNVQELYSALQTRVVDGQENPLSIIATRKFQEVQRYCSLTNHVFESFVNLISMSSWNGISDQDRAVVSRNFDEIGLLERAHIESSELDFRRTLEAAGMAFNSPDIQPFRAALTKAGYYEEWRKKFGEESWSALTQYTGPLEKI